MKVIVFFKIEDRYDGKIEEHIHYPFTVKIIEIETYIINKKIIHIPIIKTKSTVLFKHI
jgi:hypothetical protein